MTTKCARCGRITLKPALFIGVLPIGPVCARKAGLLQSKRRRGMVETGSCAQRDDRTMDLFGSAA